MAAENNNKAADSSNSYREEQTSFIHSLRGQGILDEKMDELVQLKTNDCPRFLLDVLNTFLKDADACIGKMDTMMNQPAFKYEKMLDFVHKLKGSSSSIGGHRVAHACHQLRYACDDGNKQRCIQTFNVVKTEYFTLKNNLTTILEMERAIINIELKRRHRSRT